MSAAFVLFCIFLVLKLVGVIAWSWWWVTAPLWISFVLGVVFGFLGIGVTGAAYKRARRRW